MKTFLKTYSARLHRNQKGFTLVELLVVVAIIVALAAVIIPNVVAFASTGEKGALSAEKDTLQTSMDNMMADKGITAVTANAAPSNSVNDFATKPTEGPLGDPANPYLRKNPTKFFYCWDGKGVITRQDKVATVCP